MRDSIIINITMKCSSDEKSKTILPLRLYILMMFFLHQWQCFSEESHDVDHRRAVYAQM